MNVIYLVTQLNRCGPINQALNIVSGLRSIGVNAIIVTLYEERAKTWLPRFLDKGVEVVQLHGDRRRPFTTFRRLRRLIEERKIEVVHSSGIMADLMNSLQGGRVKKLTTIRSHIADLCERRGFWERKSAQLLCRYSFSKMDLLVGCSESMAFDVHQELGRSCIAVQNSVDTEHFFPVDRCQKCLLREELGLPVDAHLLLSVGTLEHRKNFEQIINEKKKSKRSDLYLVILGSGPLKESLLHLSGNDNRIRLVAHVESPVPYYQCSDIFISASLAEGLPNTVLEAMSCGLPTLLSDIPPHHELLDCDAQAGEIFFIGDDSKLSHTIDQWCGKDLEEPSKRSRAIIKKHFSRQSMAEKYAELYAKLMGNGNAIG